MITHVSTVDELGRILLPADFRSALHIGTNCSVTMRLEDEQGAVLLTPNGRVCSVCGTLIPGSTKYPLCASCIRAIKEDRAEG